MLIAKKDDLLTYLQDTVLNHENVFLDSHSYIAEGRVITDNDPEKHPNPRRETYTAEYKFKKPRLTIVYPFLNEDDKQRKYAAKLYVQRVLQRLQNLFDFNNLECDTPLLCALRQLYETKKEKYMKDISGYTTDFLEKYIKDISIDDTTDFLNNVKAHYFADVLIKNIDNKKYRYIHHNMSTIFDDAIKIVKKNENYSGQIFYLYENGLNETIKTES